MQKECLKHIHNQLQLLNIVKSFFERWFADLNKVHLWNLDYIKKSPQAKKFKEIEDKIADASSFYGSLRNYLQILITDYIL